jgi:hypothetical protein
MFATCQARDSSGCRPPYVRRTEELNNCLDVQIGAGRRRSEEHHGLGPPRASSTTGAKEPQGQDGRDAFAVSSCRRGDEEHAGADDGDEGRGGREA